MVVDFPAPFGPRKPVTRPLRTVKLTSSTASLLPYLLATVFSSEARKAERKVELCGHRPHTALGRVVVVHGTNGWKAPMDEQVMILP